MSDKKISHSGATTVVITTPTTAPSSVTITPTAATGRIWVSTNPLVSIYPWYGQAVSAGQSATVGVGVGQTLYTYTTEPAQLSVTIT